jgi:hypothetical protein
MEYLMSWAGLEHTTLAAQIYQAMDIKAQKRTDKRSSMDMCLSYKVKNVKSINRRYNIGHPVLFLFCYSSAASYRNNSMDFNLINFKTENIWHYLLARLKPQLLVSHVYDPLHFYLLVYLALSVYNQLRRVS